MNFYGRLQRAWESSRSLVCVGLDSDPTKLPAHLREKPDSILTFNKAIVDATKDVVCCYKPNAAFYSSSGAEEQLAETISYIHSVAPDVLVILDSKRGDIANTAEMYAAESFERYNADAVTLSPYLGFETLDPYLKHEGRGSIVLCRTSNPGAKHLQDLLVDGKPLYLHVAERAKTSLNAKHNVALVVGATSPAELGVIREVVGDEIPFLVPGVGAQGGDAESVIKFGCDSRGTGVIVNSSRGIIFANSGPDFASAARAAAIALRDELNAARAKHRPQ
ncbi:MAG: orotidine-5'-phosphate decarboxylase [Deltaproteobacteria bacterium]|nr:orotidine-5'-phosphate decarboxylase [Deltaproteobacteria bacterium]